MRIWQPFLLVIALCQLASAQGSQIALLAGEWENVQQTDSSHVISHLRLAAAGTAHVELDGQFSAAFLAGSADEDVQQLAELFPEGLRIQIAADGSWEADNDSLLLAFPEPQLLINGGSFEDFIITIATALAQTVIDQLGIPAEQEPAVIATFVDLLSEDLTPADVTSQAFADDGEPTAYRVQENALVLTDAAGVESRWQRRTRSVVAPTAWGNLKSDFGSAWRKKTQIQP